MSYDIYGNTLRQGYREVHPDMIINFWVPGIPVAKGSTRSFRHAKVNMIVTQHANPKTKDYEARVACAAAEKWTGPPHDGAICVEVHFTMSRPKYHYGTGRNAGKLKLSAPHRHIKKPDIDKLVRAVLDGLTGVVWRDDCQVNDIMARKAYSEKPGTSIIVCTGGSAT